MSLLQLGELQLLCRWLSESQLPNCEFPFGDPHMARIQWLQTTTSKDLRPTNSLAKEMEAVPPQLSLH
jgi:hypothetical protein